MLQLRQCKLAFPSVHLMVGVCSDELVRKYKASPVLTSSERYESVRHCKWVDEVIEDAPWLVDAEFFAKHRIDYVAHDEEPYAMMGSDDVYGYAKSIGSSGILAFLDKVLSIRRCRCVSTYEKDERCIYVGAAAANCRGLSRGVNLILRSSRRAHRLTQRVNSEYDNKFIKLGLPDLCSTRNSTRNGSETSKKSGGGLHTRAVDELTATDGEQREVEVGSIA